MCRAKSAVKSGKSGDAEAEEMTLIILASAHFNVVIAAAVHRSSGRGTQKNNKTRRLSAFSGRASISRNVGRRDIGIAGKQRVDDGVAAIHTLAAARARANFSSAYQVGPTMSILRHFARFIGRPYCIEEDQSRK